MRKTCLYLLPLVACVLFVAGCDSQSAQINAAQQKLDKALATFAIAQQGYAPVANNASQDLQSYRQSQLATIVSDLESVLAEGSASQKKTAAQLLANVHLSAARYAARDALGQFTSLAAKTPVLDGMLHAAERSSAQALAADVDYDATLSQLAADSSTLQQQQSELRGQAETLQQQIDALKSEQQSIQSGAQQEMAKARAALDAAFIALGDEQANQQEIADAAARKAGEQSAEAEKRQVEIDLRQRRLDVIQAQLNTVTAQIADLKAQAEATRKLQSDTQAAVAAAKKVVTDQGAALKAEFDARAAEYGQVAAQFQTAAERTDKAVALLESADAAEAIGALMDKAYVNTERALTASAWASVVQMLAVISERVGLPEAGDYKAAHEKALADHAAAVTAAQEAITAAKSQTETLGEEGASANALLDGYAARLK